MLRSTRSSATKRLPPGRFLLAGAAPRGPVVDQKGLLWRLCFSKAVLNFSLTSFDTLHALVREDRYVTRRTSL